MSAWPESSDDSLDAAETAPQPDDAGLPSEPRDAPDLDADENWDDFDDEFDDDFDEALDHELEKELASKFADDGYGGLEGEDGGLDLLEVGIEADIDVVVDTDDVEAAPVEEVDEEAFEEP